MASADPPPDSFRRTRRGLRRVLFTASSLVGLAATQLFVLTTHTDRFFAWTIAPPQNRFLTAGFLGASYVASFFLEYLAAREALWARARVAVAPVWLFTVLSLVATWLHIDRFHLGPPLGQPAAPLTLFFGWFWLFIYTVVPIWMGWQWWRQRGDPGVDPPRERPLPGYVRAPLAVQGAAMAVVGVGLFVAPTAVATLWPWPLTPLTARMVGAWLVGFAVAAYGGLRENDLARSRPAVAAYTALGVLQLVTLARFAGDVDRGSAAVWVYAAFLVSVAAVGGAALWADRRAPSR